MFNRSLLWSAAIFLALLFFPNIVSSAQDILVTKQNKIILAKVTGIDGDVVSYTDYPDGKVGKQISTGQLIKINYKTGFEQTFSSSAIANNSTTEKTERSDIMTFGALKGYRKGGEPTNDVALRDMFGPDYTNAMKAARLAKIGVLTEIIGGSFAIIGTVGMFLDMEDADSENILIGGIIMATGGVAALYVGLPLHLVGRRKAKKIVNHYNKSNGYASSVSLSLSPNGFGLKYNF